jgi:hypothetical protein
MDLISGIAIVTAVFLIAIAIVAHSLARMPWPNGEAEDVQLEQVIHRRSRTTFVTLLIGFFVGLADVLVAAQLPVIAFLNVAVGAATIAILYSVSRQNRGESDHWRR